MMTENKNAGVVWRPQPRQMEFMRRPEPEALYGGAAGGGEDRRRHRQSAAAAGRRKRTTRAHDDRLPGKKAMEQTDGITGSSPPRLREIPGGAAFRCLWANMWSKGCGAERNA